MLVKLFISYAHKDVSICEELRVGLAELKRQGLVEDWHDRQIPPGSVWAGEIDCNLNSAHIVLLLVSPDFIASNYCYEVEMVRALERHEKGKTLVVPILVRPVPNFRELPFAHIQPLPRNCRAITEWPDHDQALRDVVEELKTLILSLSPSRPNPRGPNPLPNKRAYRISMMLTLVAMLLGVLYWPWPSDRLNSQSTQPAEVIGGASLPDGKPGNKTTATVLGHPPFTKMSGKELVTYLRPLSSNERYEQLLQVSAGYLASVLRKFYETDRHEFGQFVGSLNESQLSSLLWSAVETIPYVQETFTSEEDFRKDPKKIEDILSHDQRGLLEQLLRLQRKAAVANNNPQ